MVVNLNAGVEAVRAYVAEQAARGREHVRDLVAADRDRMLELTVAMTQDEAAFKPASEEYSALECLQHLNGSFDRSVARLKALSSGRPFAPPAQRVAWGGIPEGSSAAFDEVRARFAEGEAAVLAVLDAADPQANLGGTADHAEFGPYKWLEWATYSHHVHTSDHIQQVVRLREAYAARESR